jgi:hypothetical protein
MENMVDSAGTPSEPRIKRKTWRILNIPRSVSKESLKCHLENLAGSASETDEAVENVVQLSLAPYSLQHACATVTFNKPPLFLENPDLEPYKDGYYYDSNFIGFTPLYEYGGEEGPLAE